MQENILIVDDEKTIRDLLMTIIQRDGFNVALAADGYEAIRYIDSENFCLAIIDINLPDVDGIQLLNKIKAECEDTEVIIISGQATLETAIQAVRLGASDYIVKPFDVQSIRKVVRKSIEKYRLSVQKKKHVIELENKNRELGMLYELHRTIEYPTDYDELMEPIMSSLQNVLKYDISAFLSFDDKFTEVMIWANSKTSQQAIQHVTRDIISAFKEISGKEISGKMLTVKVNERDYLPVIDQSLVSSLNIPLAISDGPHGKIIGMVNFSSHERSAFDSNASKLFHSVANEIISDALRKQKQVQDEEQELLSTMLESMSDGVLVVDRKKTLLNPAGKRLLGIGNEYNINDIIDRVSGTKLASILSNIRTKELENTSFEEEFRVNETSVFIGVNVSPLKGKSRRNAGIVAVMRDITKKKEIEEAKSNFISTASHELRTPVTAIQNAILIIEMAGELNEDQRKFLSVAKRNIERLTKVTNELLDFSRLESGKMKMDFEPVNVKMVADGVVNNLHNLATLKKITIINNIPDDLPNAYADPNKLDQVFTNLIDNAIKYTPEGGTVTLEAEVLQDDPSKQRIIKVRVSDTGIGISPEDKERIFESFERATLFNKGVGLGLAITKKIIDNHNGKIWVESELGKGSSFMFTIPVYEGEPPK